MKRLIRPERFGGDVTAFFTGKDPGADPALIGSLLKIGKEDIYLPVQRHTDKVLHVGPMREPAVADAVITKEKGILIGVQVADCVPVLLHGKTKGVVAAVHAGWRGTAEGILKKTIRIMIDVFYCSEKNIVAAIGPSIRGCSYEVGGAVLRPVREATGEGQFFRAIGEKYFLDLAQANRIQAVSMGIPEENIWISPDCTFCNPEKYYSYRYGRGSAAGRQGGFIGLL